MVGMLLGVLVLLFTELTTVVTYFSPFGVERGVGPNVFVVVNGDVENRSCFTDNDSECHVSLPNSKHVDVIAFYESGSPWFVFECKRGKDIRDAQELLVVRCKRVYTMRFPWAQGGRG